jgi:hypothetical protein
MWLPCSAARALARKLAEEKQATLQASLLAEQHLIDEAEAEL